MKTLALLAAFSTLVAPSLLAQETYGTIHATTRINGDGTSSTTIIDPEKHTAEETYTDASKPPRVLKKITYILGDHDLAVGAIFYDGKGNVSYKANYQRDPSGRISEAAFISADDQYLGKRVFVYGAGKTASQVVDYDAAGQVITPPPTAAAAGKPAPKKHR